MKQSHVHSTLSNFCRCSCSDQCPKACGSCQAWIGLFYCVDMSGGISFSLALRQWIPKVQSQQSHLYFCHPSHFQSNWADFRWISECPWHLLNPWAEARPEDLDDEDMGVPLEAEEAKVPCSPSPGVRKMFSRLWREKESDKWYQW